MSIKIEEFVAHLGWEVDASQLEDFNSQVKDTVAFFAKIAAAIAGATAALTAFTVATNKQTSIQTQLAEAYDISAESAENWGYMLGAVGLEAENVIRSAKDLNVRLGQAFAGIGDAKTMKDAVRSLGLEFKALQDLKPEEQFRTILQAAKDLDNSQVALAASQQLLGRQGVIITGYLRDQQGTIEELLEEQAKFNLLTQENREQAIRFTGLWDNTTAVLDSAKASFAAFLGEALSPLLKEFLEWVKANRELIKLKIKEWAEKVGYWLGVIFRIIKNGLFYLKEFVDRMGGLERVLKALGILLAGIGIWKIVNAVRAAIPLVMSLVSAVKALRLASVLLIAKWVGLLALFALAGLAINSLIRFFQGKDSLVGDIGDKIAEQLHKWIGAFAEWLGFSKEEFDVWLVGVVDGTVDAFAAAWEHVSEFFAEMAALDWAGVAEGWAAVWSMFVSWLGRLWADFVDWLTVDVPNQVLTAFRNMLQTAVNMIQKLPIISGLVDNEERPPGAALGRAATAGAAPGERAERVTPRQIGKGVQEALANISAGITIAPAQQPSSTVMQTINQTRALQNTINNVSRDRGPTTITVPMTINQREGESGEALARRIQSGIRKEFAQAIRDNDTGIDF